MFDALTIQDARSILWLKRAFAFAIVVLLVIGAPPRRRHRTRAMDPPPTANHARDGVKIVLE